MLLRKLFPLLLLTLLTACDGCEEDMPKTELEKLPPATQEGKNTFGCLVNGKAWVTKSSIDAVAFYQSGVLQIGASIQEKDCENSMGLIVRNSSIEVKSYSLNTPPLSEAEFIDYSNTICIYDVNHTLNGDITFSKHDTEKLIISGTFKFKTVTESCDTINVTNGRFDLTYAN